MQDLQNSDRLLRTVAASVDIHCDDQRTHEVSLLQVLKLLLCNLFDYAYTPLLRSCCVTYLTVFTPAAVV